MDFLNQQKSYMLHCIQKNIFGIMPAYTQIYLMEVLKVLIILYRLKLRPLNSNLKACIAPRMALESTLGPSSTTQTSEIIEQHPESLYSPSRGLGEYPRTPYYHSETIEGEPVQPFMWHWRLPKDPITPPREY